MVFVIAIKHLLDARLATTLLWFIKMWVHEKLHPEQCDVVAYPAVKEFVVDEEQHISETNVNTDASAMHDQETGRGDRNSRTRSGKLHDTGHAAMVLDPASEVAIIDSMPDDEIEVYMPNPKSIKT